MNLRTTCLFVVCCIALTGCTTGRLSTQPETQGDFHHLVESEVRATISAFMNGFSSSTCEDVSPVTKHVRDQMIDVDSGGVTTISHHVYEQGLKGMICDWSSHTGIVDRIVVDALSRDVAVAAWTYRDEVKMKSGKTQQYNGSALMTLVRLEDGWKITSTSNQLSDKK